MDELIRKYEVFKGNSVFEEDASYDDLQVFIFLLPFVW